MGRFLDKIQIALMLISVTAVIDASRVEAAEDRPGYYPQLGADRNHGPDRRFADLARLDRRGREDLQRRAQRLARTAAVSSEDGPRSSTF